MDVAVKPWGMKVSGWQTALLDCSCNCYRAFRELACFAFVPTTAAPEKLWLSCRCRHSLISPAVKCLAVNENFSVSFDLQWLLERKLQCCFMLCCSRSIHINIKTTEKLMTLSWWHWCNTLKDFSYNAKCKRSVLHDPLRLSHHRSNLFSRDQGHKEKTVRSNTQPHHQLTRNWDHEGTR